jgi:uncharacterized protein YqcC (DUF446 family)
MTVQMPHQRDRKLRAEIGRLADEIEAEMRRLGLWSADPPPEDRVLEGGAFGRDTVGFEQWIQVVLVARLRAVAAGELDPPTSSMVGTAAIREWDGIHERESLASLLSRLDGVIVRGGPA